MDVGLAHWIRGNISAADVGWRKVEDVPPPEGRDILVYAPRDGFRWPSFVAVMCWSEDWGWWPGQGERITHWMPLPLPPEG